MRLIDADALMKSIGCEDATKYGNKTAEQQHNSYSTMMMYEIADEIDDAPTIDAEPVRHGVWEYQPATLCTKAGYQCTACRGSVWNSPDVPQAFKRCPECGAIMDGGAER